MIHIEIQPGAIATFESEPTPEELDVLRGVAAHFGDPIENFLSKNRKDIPTQDRFKLREAAAKSIRDEKVAIDMSHCPVNLRDAFRRLVWQAAYKHREKGKFVDAKREYLP